jgi:hypothetical protein
MANVSHQFNDIIARNITHNEEHRMTARAFFGNNHDYKGALPCQTCGDPVPEDTWHEEMGYCVECQHNAFDHSDEEK